jgi:hypothetical protein
VWLDVEIHKSLLLPWHELPVLGVDPATGNALIERPIRTDKVSWRLRLRTDDGIIDAILFLLLDSGCRAGRRRIGLPVDDQDFSVSLPLSTESIKNRAIGTVAAQDAIGMCE